jgi:hypothetical protein
MGGSEKRRRSDLKLIKTYDKEQHLLTSAVFGAGLISGILRGPAISIHVDKVESTIKAAGQLADVNRECNLAILELEHLVRAFVFHQKEARANVGGVGSAGDKANLQLVAIGVNAI